MGILLDNRYNFLNKKFQMKNALIKKSHLINGKAMQLFRDSEMIARKSISQKDFEELMQGENALKVITACEKGFAMAREQICNTSPVFQNRNYKANLINSYIQGCLIEQFPYTSGLCKGSRYFFKVDDNMLFCKKLNKDFKPSNITTRAVIMYNDQKSDDFSDTCPITYIGYQVSSSYSELMGVYAVHMSGGDIEWISDLSELAYISTRLPIKPTSEDIVEVSVIPKREIGYAKVE